MSWLLQVQQEIIHHYRPKGWCGIAKQQFKSLIRLVLSSLSEQRQPRMVHCTVWLSKGKTISDLTDALRKWVIANPVKNGFRKNKNTEIQKYRSKPRCLYAWAREVKDTSAPDCVHESVEHYHLILIYDSSFFRKSTWPFFIMEYLQQRGIIAAHPEESNTAWHVSGFHQLGTKENIIGALKHASYICKLDQKQTTPHRRNFGTSTHLVCLNKKHK